MNDLEQAMTEDQASPDQPKALENPSAMTGGGVSPLPKAPDSASAASGPNPLTSLISTVLPMIIAAAG